MQASLLDFNEAIKTCHSTADFFHTFEQTLRNYGVLHMSYGALSSQSGQISIKQVDLFHVSYPPSLRRAVGGLRRYSDDLTICRAQCGLDTIWTDQSLWTDATKVQIAQNNREIEAGVRLGYTHVLGNFGLKKASIGFDLSGMADSEFHKNWAELSKIILPIAQVMHTHFTKTHLSKHYNLTPREMDVLSWLVMGLRPDEIADKLSVGYRTVDKYVVSAKAKLGANTRDHAVARALAMGLLEI